MIYQISKRQALSYFFLLPKLTFSCPIALNVSAACRNLQPLYSRGQRGQRGQLCPFLIAIELFSHPNNFASDVRNVINESELIVAGRHWSMIGKFICAIKELQL